MYTWCAYASPFWLSYSLNNIEQQAFCIPTLRKVLIIPVGTKHSEPYSEGSLTGLQDDLITWKSTIKTLPTVMWNVKWHRPWNLEYTMYTCCLYVMKILHPFKLQLVNVLQGKP